MALSSSVAGLGSSTGATILSEAATNLENGNWTQGAFLGFLDNSGKKEPCFCAHGSIGYCGNDPFKVRDKIDRGKQVIIGMDLPPTMVSNNSERFKSRQKSFQTDPQLQPYYHLWLAQSFAWTVGCTYAWNDTPGRTKIEVIAKLREAALLAADQQDQYL